MLSLSAVLTSLKPVQTLTWTNLSRFTLSGSARVSWQSRDEAKPSRTWLQALTHNMYTCMYVWYGYKYVCMYVCIYIYICVCVCVCLCVCVCVCVCVFIYICIYQYTYIFTKLPFKVPSNSESTVAKGTDWERVCCLLELNSVTSTPSGKGNWLFQNDVFAAAFSGPRNTLNPGTDVPSFKHALAAIGGVTNSGEALSDLGIRTVFDQLSVVCC